MAIPTQVSDSRSLKGDTQVEYLSIDQKSFDSLFRQQFGLVSVLSDKVPVEPEESARPSSPSEVSQIAREYFGSFDERLESVDRMFDGSSVNSRVQGSEAFMQIRKKAGREMFEKAIRPKIENLLIESG